MKITDINHKGSYINPSATLPTLSAISVVGSGVKVTLLQRASAIDVYINPVDENFITLIDYGDAHLGATQTRLTVSGKDLRDDPAKLRAWLAAELSNAADRVVRGRFEDAPAELEDLLSKLIVAVRA